MRIKIIVDDTIQKRRKIFNKKLLSLVVTAACTVMATPTLANEFSLGSNWEGTFDTSLTYSTMIRVRDADPSLMTIGVGGNEALGQDASNHNPNTDDGNFNFESGDQVTNTFKVSYDLNLTRKLDSGATLGFFNRGLGFYDSIIKDEGTAYDGTTQFVNNRVSVGADPTDFSDDTKDRIGSDAKFLDAFVYYQGDLGEMPLVLRAGRQVINWGENAFIQSGISNAINPADVTQAKLPGTAVKDILLPQGAVFGSIGLSDSVTVEAYYQYEWKRTIAPASGTFFSTNDFIAEDGGESLILPTPANFDGPHPFYARAENVEPSDSGQWGLSLRWFSEDLNETDFGFYALNYHSKLPTIGVSGKPTPGATYNIGYLEDIKLYGLSFNTVAWDTAFSGEVAYHEGAQVQTVRFGPAAIGKGIVANGDPSKSLIATPENIVVSQLTINRNLSSATGFRDLADSANFIVEVGSVYTPDLEDGELFRGLDRADQFAWGFKGRLRLSYFNAIGELITAFSGTDLGVDIVYAQGVDGVSAIPAGSFTEDAKALGLTFNANWQNSIEASLGYNYFSDSVLEDRDNVTFTLKYLF
ncbi:MAG: DUF1302 domain-containing protein [Colwellia sp.]